MHAKGVRHIRDLILLISNLMDLRHWALVLDVLIGGSGESSLSEASLEDFHDAVGICVARMMLVLGMTTPSCAFESASYVHGGYLKVVDFIERSSYRRVSC